jgi:hypothetical protein
MRKMIGWLKLTALVGLCLLATTTRGDEEKVALDKVPKAVLDAVKAKFTGAEMVGASKEVEDGKTVYEISVKLKGQHIDVTLKPDGTITLIEKEIAAKDVPGVVTKALETKYPKATWKKAEEVFKVESKTEKLAYYEVLLVTVDKKTFEVQVDPSGKLVNEEKKDNDKDDKDKKKE